MKTIISKPSTTSYEKAGELIREGKLVAFPTETVYGIGANAMDSQAVKSIFKVKGRPVDNPLIVHICEKGDVFKYAKNISEDANILMDKFWPGPLTIVLEKKELVPDTITAGLGTVAIRMPENEVALNIIRHAGVPVAAPSANISGKPSPTNAAHVIEDLDGKVDMIIDGGCCDIGLESTVIDLTSDTPTILRPGKITKKILSEYVSINDYNADEVAGVPKSPGMKYRHYSPSAKIILYSGNKNKIIEKINQDVQEYFFKGQRVGAIIEKEYYDAVKCRYKYDIGSCENEDEVAKNLFKILRQLDEDNIEVAFITSLSDRHIGSATMNRLLKASSQVIEIN